jgi:outer membrane protein assembly factor BamD (BamD/ComL family)
LDKFREAYVMKKLFVFLLVALFVFLLTPHSIRIFQQCISSKEKSSWAPTAQYKLGNFCFWTLRYSQAAECYGTLLNKYPVAKPAQLATSMFRLAISYERIKNYAAAVEAYDRFAGAYPSHKSAGHALSQSKKLRALHQ